MVWVVQQWKWLSINGEKIKSKIIVPHSYFLCNPWVRLGKRLVTVCLGFHRLGEFPAPYNPFYINYMRVVGPSETFITHVGNTVSHPSSWYWAHPQLQWTLKQLCDWVVQVIIPKWDKVGKWHLQFYLAISSPCIMLVAEEGDSCAFSPSEDSIGRCPLFP